MKPEDRHFYLQIRIFWWSKVILVFSHSNPSNHEELTHFWLMVLFSSRENTRKPWVFSRCKVGTLSRNSLKKNDVRVFFSANNPEQFPSQKFWMVFKSSLKTLTRIKLSTHYKFAISLKSPNKKECVQHLLPVQVPFTSKNHQIILNISVKRFCESGMFVARKPLKPVRFYEFYRRPN